MKNVLQLAQFLLILSIISSCKGADPNPELKDKIYQDLRSELDIAKRNTQGEVAQLEKVSQELKEVVPQSGILKHAAGRVFASQNQLDVYRQQEKYFEVKLEQRRIYVQKRYLESLLPAGRPWPDPAEEQEYEIRLKLRRAKLEWDKKNVPRGTASEKEKEGAKTSDSGAEPP